MNRQKLYESLSALMDNEAAELELRQVLKQSAENEQLRHTWQRWQIVRTALRRESQQVLTADLATRVSLALKAQDVEQNEPLPRTSAPVKLRLLVGTGQLAMAASVTLAVLGGVRFYQYLQQPQDVSPMQAQQIAPKTPARLSLPLAVPPQLVGYGGVARAPAQVLPAPSVEQADWQSERLPTYLHQHNRQGALYQGIDGILPYARAASFSGQ